MCNGNSGHPNADKPEGFYSYRDGRAIVAPAIDENLTQARMKAVCEVGGNDQGTLEAASRR